MKNLIRQSILTCLSIVLCTFSSPFLQAQTSFTVGSTPIEVTTVAQNLHVPWELVWGPDDHIWFTERDCTIGRLNPETGAITTLVSIADCYEQQESGLLGMALHPDFANSPYAYVVYNYSSSGNIKEKLVRYTYNAGNNTLGSPVTMIDNIGGASIHNGSRLLILADNTLLMTTGDASDTSTSQDLSSLNGKFLRFNLDGSIPADNPNPNSYVYSFGHRNAQGLTLGTNGIIYSSEHGPTSDDEINIIEMNRNYGWPTVAGFCNTTNEQTFCNANNVVEPLRAWTPTLAVAGLAYYDHSAIPEWQNNLLLCNLKERDIRLLQLSEDGLQIVNEEIYLDGEFGRFRAICTAPDGRVFISTSNNDAYGSPGQGDDRILQLKSRSVFQASANTACSGDMITFEDIVGFDATSWSWTFEGGTPATSSASMPTVTYNTGGSFSVSLTVSNGTTSDTYTAENYITVLDLNASNGLPYSQVVNPNNDALAWTTSSNIACNNTVFAANNNDNNAVGREDILEATFDLSGFSNCQLQFDVSYARYSASYFDGMKVIVTSCSGGSETVFDKSGSDLATASDVSGAYSPNSCDDWRTENIDLSAYDGQQIQVQFININGWGNWLYLDNIALDGEEASAVVVQLKALLSGSYDATTNMMRTDLRDANLLPTTQPYNEMPWNYSGNESVAGAFNNAVDWVLVEARDANDLDMVVETKAGILMKDGSIVDADAVTNGLNFMNLMANESYYFVIRHRNHLDVISSGALSVPNVAAYDFSDINMVMNGDSQLEDVGNEQYAMWAGDMQANGVITVGDFNTFLLAAGGLNAYMMGDANLDGVVTIADFNAYFPSASKIGVSWVRY